MWRDSLAHSGGSQNDTGFQRVDLALALPPRRVGKKGMAEIPRTAGFPLLRE